MPPVRVAPNARMHAHQAFGVRNPKLRARLAAAAATSAAAAANKLVCDGARDGCCACERECAGARVCVVDAAACRDAGEEVAPACMCHPMRMNQGRHNAITESQLACMCHATHRGPPRPTEADRGPPLEVRPMSSREGEGGAHSAAATAPPPVKQWSRRALSQSSRIPDGRAFRPTRPAASSSSAST